MMKMILSTGLLICSALSLLAQEDAYEGDPTTIYWGWEVGIESGLIFGSASPNAEAAAKFNDVKGNIGVGVSAGFSASFPLSEKLALRPQILLTILPTTVTYDFANFKEATHEIYPLTCDIPIHLAINNPLQTRKMGLLIGPAIEFRIPALESGRPKASTAVLRADIGIALPKLWGKSDILIELVYGATVTNMLTGGDDVFDSWYENVGRHRLGLRMNFY